MTCLLRHAQMQHACQNSRCEKSQRMVLSIDLPFPACVLLEWVSQRRCSSTRVERVLVARPHAARAGPAQLYPAPPSANKVRPTAAEFGTMLAACDATDLGTAQCEARGNVFRDWCAALYLQHLSVATTPHPNAWSSSSSWAALHCDQARCVFRVLPTAPEQSGVHGGADAQLALAACVLRIVVLLSFSARFLCRSIHMTGYARRYIGYTDVRSSAWTE